MSKRMLVSAVSITLFIGILIMLLPDFSQVAKERVASTSMMMCIGKIKAGVVADIKKGNTIKTDYEIKCPKLISKLEVFDSGKIEVFNPKYKIHLSLLPTMSEGKVKWLCQGTPAEHVPAACRIKTAQQAN